MLVEARAWRCDRRELLEWDVHGCTSNKCGRSARIQSVKTRSSKNEKKTTRRMRMLCCFDFYSKRNLYEASWIPNNSRPI